MNADDEDSLTLLSQGAGAFCPSSELLYLPGKDNIAVSTAGGERLFRFPANMKLGFISKGFDPVLAAGEIEAAKSEPVVLYTQKQLAGAPELLSRIGPDCLDGLECIFDEPAKLKPILANWCRLKRLSLILVQIKSPVKAEREHLDGSLFTFDFKNWR